jgi:hypothetical protein
MTKARRLHLPDRTTAASASSPAERGIAGVPSRDRWLHALGRCTKPSTWSSRVLPQI